MGRNYKNIGNIFLPVSCSLPYPHLLLTPCCRILRCISQYSCSVIEFLSHSAHLCSKVRAETQLFSDKNHLFPHSPGLAIRISISYFPADCYKGSIFCQLFQTAFQNTTCFLKYSKYKEKRLAIGRAFPSMVFCKYRKYKHPVFATFSTVVNYFPRFDFDRIFQSAVIMKPGALTSSLPSGFGTFF